MQPKSRRRKLTRLALAASLAFGAGTTAHAATISWTGTTNGNMTGTTTNWSTGAVPGSGDVAQWNAATYTNAPTANAAMSIGQLLFGASNTAGVTFGAGTGVITIGHTSSTIGIEMLNGSGAVNTGGAGFAVSKDQTWRNNSASLLTIGGNITNSVNNAARTLTLFGTGNILLSGITSDNTASGKISLTKAGSGTLTLSNANTYTGTTSVNAGTLTLDYTTVAGKLADTSVLALGGGTLNLANGASAHNEVVGSTTLNAGLSNITRTSGTSVLRMNGITRNTGSILNLGAASIADTDTSNDATGILGGWATINGTDWATSAASASDTAITAYTGYTNDTWAAANNVTVTTSSAPTSGSTANSLRFNAAAANTVTLAGTNTLTSGGLLVTSAVGNNLSKITGGTLRGASGKDLVVIQNNTANGLTIESIIADNTSATALTKAGGGLLTLSGNNSFTGGVYIAGGTVLLNNAGALNSTTANAVTFTNTTGTLTLNGNSATIASLASSANLSSSTGIIVQNANNTGATLTTGGSNASTAFYGVLQNGTGTGKLALTKTGTGTFTLYGANTIGDVTISNGTLFTENNNTFGTVSVASGKILQLGGGDASYTTTIDGLSGAGTVQTANSGGMTRTLTLGNNNATADFSGVIAQALNRNLNFNKTGTGAQTLSGSTANTASAVGSFLTNVQNGTLILNKTNAVALPGNVTISGGTLQLSGSGDNQIADTASVSWSGGAFDLNGKSETIGALTLSVNSASDNVLNIAAGKTLTVAGLTLGKDATGGTTKLVTSGTGSFSSTGNFVVGVSSATDNTLTNVANFSTLSSFAFNGTNFTLGGPGGADLRYGTTTVTLSSTLNDVTATTLNISSSGSRNHSTTLNFAGTSEINADTINVAAGYNGDGDLIATSGSLNIRNKAGTGAANLIIADRAYNGTGTTNTGVVNLAGATVNALIGTLTMADSTGDATRTGTSTGTLIFGTTGDTTSTMDVTTINLTTDPGNTTVGTSSATIDIRGGTFRFDTMNVGVNRTNFTANTSLLLKGGTFAALNATANTITGLDTLQIGGVGGVTFGQTSGGTGGLDITATAITLGASTTQTVNVATTLNGTISATTNTMEKLGAGTLTLSGTASNLNTGLVTVTAGELDLNKTATFNAIGGNLTVSGGTAKLLAANQLPDASTVTVSSGSFNTNNLTETVGTFNMSGGSIDGTTGTLTAATYGLTGGTVNAKLGTGAITVNTGTVTLGSAGRFNAASTLSIQGGQLTIAGTESVASYTQTGGTLAGTGFTLTSAAAYDMQAGAVSANLGGSGIALNKTTSGTVTLSGTNSYSGVTTISSGILSIGSAGGLGSGNVTNNATLNLTAGGVTYTGLSNTGAGALGGNGTVNVTLGTGTASTILNGNYSSFTGILNIGTGAAAGAGKVQTNGADNASATYNVLNHGTLYITSGGTRNADLTLGGGDTGESLGQLRVDTAALNWAGAITLSGSVTGSGDFTFGGSSNLTISGGIGESNGSQVLKKGGAGTLIIASTASYSGITTVSAGTLQIGNAGTVGTLGSGAVVNAGTLAFNRTDTYTLGSGNFVTGAGAVRLNSGTIAAAVDSQFNTTGSLTIGASAGATTVANLDLSNGSSTFGSMLVQTDSASVNTLTIGTGKTLQINGAVTVGYNSAATSTTKLTATGLGTLSIGTSVTPTNANVQIGNGQTNDFSNGATLDMSGLSTFYANLGTGTFRVGDPTNGSGTGTAGSSLILAANSTIQAATLTTDSPSSGVTNAIKLGSGTSILNVNTLTVGGNAGRSNGTLTFNTGTGTLKVRSQSDPVNGRATLNVGNVNFGTGLSQTGNVFNTNGHSADLYFGTMTIGSRGDGAGTTGGTFSFDTGTLDANALVVGNRAPGADGTATTTGIVNLGGGTAVFNSTAGPVQLGTNESTTTGSTASGTLNISDGNVTVAANAGNSFRLGHSSVAGGTANGTLNLTGGTLTVAGDIIRGSATGASTATLNLDGGTLDMGGNEIGGSVASSNLTSLTFASGTLKNVAEINNGANISKTTGGTLIIDGTNGYTGTTTVVAGVLAVNGSLTATSNSVTVQNLATLQGSGTIAGDVAIQSGGTLAAGSSIGSLATGTLSMAANSTFAYEIDKSAAGGDLSGDLTAVIGSLTLANTNDVILSLAETGGSGAWSIGDKLTLISYTGTSFGGLFKYGASALGDDTGFVFSGVDWLFNYNDTAAGDNYTGNLTGNRYVTMTVVPEPSTTTLGLLAVAGLLMRRRRQA